jgi:hypothetical protein
VATTTTNPTTAAAAHTKKGKGNNKKKAATAMEEVAEVPVVDEVCSALRSLLRGDHSRQADVQVVMPFPRNASSSCLF